MYWVIEAIVQLLRAQKGVTNSPLSSVKRVYFGDPITIPQASFPVLVVMPISSAYQKRGTRYDRKKHTVEIRLIENAENYMPQNADGNAVPKVQEFIRKMELTNSDGKTDVESIAGVIQSNPTLPYQTNPVTTTQYAALDTAVRDVTYQFNSGGRPFPTFEVVLTLDAIVQGDRA